MKTKPRIFYLTEFPRAYRLTRWFDDEDSARRCVRHIRQSYNIRGKVIKVKECPKTTKKKNQ